MKAARTVEFLITRLAFADKQPIGLALARVARALRPDVRIIFTGNPNHKDNARGVGDFMEEPIFARQAGMLGRVAWRGSSRLSDLCPCPAGGVLGWGPASGAVLSAAHLRTIVSGRALSLGLTSFVQFIEAPGSSQLLAWSRGVARLARFWQERRTPDASGLS
jgi:hypothetical protein